MRALTVRQPWAWAIVHGGKSPENRPVNVAGDYRGELAIHAGAKVSERGLASWLVQKAAQRVDPDRPVVLPFNGKVWRHESLALGAVIGVVDLVDVHLDVDCHDRWGGCHPWGEFAPSDGRPLRHLVVENPRPLTTPIPARGYLHMWTPGPDLLAQIREQVPA